MLGQFYDGLLRLFLGIGLGLGFVGKDYVHIILHQVVEESQIGIHHVIGSHIDGNGAPGLLGQTGGLGDEFLVLNQIALDVEIIVALELLQRQVVRSQFQRGAHVIGKSTLGIGAGDEHHASAGRLGAVEHLRFHAVLLHGALEEVAQVVVANLAQEAGRHPEDGGTGDGIGCAAARHIFDAVFLENLPDMVSGFHIHVLHTSQRKVEFAQERVVRKNGQDVGEGIADAKDGFHSVMWDLSGQRYPLFADFPLPL